MFRIRIDPIHITQDQLSILNQYFTKERRRIAQLGADASQIIPANVTFEVKMPGSFFSTQFQLKSPLLLGFSKKARQLKKHTDKPFDLKDVRLYVTDTATPKLGAGFNGEVAKIHGVLKRSMSGELVKVVKSAPSRIVKTARCSKKTLERIVEVAKDESRFAELMGHSAKPPVIHVPDEGEITTYNVMHFLKGADLRKKLVSPGLGDQWIDIFVRLGRNLQKLHGKKLIHSDLKPENVMIGPHGEVQIIDFGNTKQQDTSIDHQIGTPHYAPPEDFSGNKSMDTSFDVFSFAVMMLEALPLSLTPHPFMPGRNLWIEGQKATVKNKQLLVSQLIQKIETTKSKVDAKYHPILDICAQALDPEPQRRPTLERILQVLHGVQFAQMITAAQNPLIQDDPRSADYAAGIAFRSYLDQMPLDDTVQPNSLETFSTALKKALREIPDTPERLEAFLKGLDEISLSGCHQSKGALFQRIDEIQNRYQAYLAEARDKVAELGPDHVDPDLMSVYADISTGILKERRILSPDKMQFYYNESRFAPVLPTQPIRLRPSRSTLPHVLIEPLQSMRSGQIEPVSSEPQTKTWRGAIRDRWHALKAYFFQTKETLTVIDQTQPSQRTTSAQRMSEHIPPGKSKSEPEKKKKLPLEARLEVRYLSQKEEAKKHQRQERTEERKSPPESTRDARTHSRRRPR